MQFGHCFSSCEPVKSSSDVSDYSSSAQQYILLLVICAMLLWDSATLCFSLCSWFACMDEEDDIK